MWRRVSCDKQLNRMSDLSRKLECFGHVVAVFHAHFDVEHRLPFNCDQYLVCLPFVCVPNTLLLCNALDATSSRLKALQTSKIILSVASVSTCLFITTFEQIHPYL